MDHKEEQKGLFNKEELPKAGLMSSKLRRIFLIFQDGSKEEDRIRAVKHFIQYGQKQAEKNSPESLEEIINFARKFRNLRGPGRQYIEEQFFFVLKVFISTSHSILIRPDKFKISISNKTGQTNDKEINKASEILLKIIDFIEETLNYKPTGRDVLNGGRKAMAVKIMEALIYCIEYPRLQEILIQALMINYKAAVLTAIDIIYYNHLSSSKIRKALGTLARTSKDQFIRNQAEGVLNSLNA